MTYLSGLSYVSKADQYISTGLLLLADRLSRVYMTSRLILGANAHTSLVFKGANAPMGPDTNLCRKIVGSGALGEPT